LAPLILLPHSKHSPDAPLGRGDCPLLGESTIDPSPPVWETSTRPQGQHSKLICLDWRGGRVRFAFICGATGDQAFGWGRGPGWPSDSL